MSGDELVAIFIRLAQSQLYVREIGQNRGPAVEQYQKAGNNLPGASWCMDFMIWCLDIVLGRDKMPLRRSGRVQDVYDAAKDLACIYQQPLEGDIFVKYYPSLNRFAHTGAVAQLKGLGSFESVEGNGNKQGGNNGYGVISKTRANARDAAHYEFIRWRNLV